MTVPPVEEQCEIVSITETQLEMLDTLTTEAERAIELLQERRTALWANPLSSISNPLNSMIDPPSAKNLGSSSSNLGSFHGKPR